MDSFGIFPENDVQGKDSPADTASSMSSVDDAWDRMTALYSRYNCTASIV